ncbi:MAG: hypothetical protein ACREL3_05260 [Gemmatimonadales bacterium]
MNYVQPLASEGHLLRVATLTIVVYVLTANRIVAQTPDTGAVAQPRRTNDPVQQAAIEQAIGKSPSVLLRLDSGGVKRRLPKLGKDHYEKLANRKQPTPQEKARSDSTFAEIKKWVNAPATERKDTTSH